MGRRGAAHLERSLGLSTGGRSAEARTWGQTLLWGERRPAEHQDAEGKAGGKGAPSPENDGARRSGVGDPAAVTPALSPAPNRVAVTSAGAGMGKGAWPFKWPRPAAARASRCGMRAGRVRPPRPLLRASPSDPGRRARRAWPQRRGWVETVRRRAMGARKRPVGRRGGRACGARASLRVRDCAVRGGPAPCPPWPPGRRSGLAAERAGRGSLLKEGARGDAGCWGAFSSLGTQGPAEGRAAATDPLPGGPRFAAPAPGAALGTPRDWSSLWTWPQEGVGGDARAARLRPGAGGGDEGGQAEETQQRLAGLCTCVDASLWGRGSEWSPPSHSRAWPGRSARPGHPRELGREQDPTAARGSASSPGNQ